MRQTINITVSLPIDLVKKLKVTVGQSKINSFVADSIAESLHKQSELLKAEYRAAASDKERINDTKDWEVLDL